MSNTSRTIWRGEGVSNTSRTICRGRVCLTAVGQYGEVGYV